jgi:hypothetical protein
MNAWHAMHSVLLSIFWSLAEPDLSRLKQGVSKP